MRLAFALMLRLRQCFRKSIQSTHRGMLMNLLWRPAVWDFRLIFSFSEISMRALRKKKRLDKDEEELLNQFEWVFFKTELYNVLQFLVVCFFFFISLKTFYCVPRSRRYTPHTLWLYFSVSCRWLPRRFICGENLCRVIRIIYRRVLSCRKSLTSHQIDSDIIGMAWSCMFVVVWMF